ncbi:MAG: RNA polymerase sigma factor [Acidimicrobiales bacterium]
MTEVPADARAEAALVGEADATSASSALTRLARDDSGRVLAILARRFGDLDLADDAVQDALVDAARTWPTDGVPDNPAAWLLSVARRRAIDRLRRRASAQRRTAEAAPDLVGLAEGSDVGGAALIEEQGTIPDERLRLILLCCHPALDRDTQVALTLRLVGGLETTEIAAAYLVPPATLAQRIVRAKRKIRVAAMPLSIPENLEERIDAVLGVLYLIFNEGYLSRSATEEPIRVDLMAESIRLTRVVRALAPEHGEVAGLLALQLFAQARVGSRVDTAGDIVLLDQQDRMLWDRSIIAEAMALLTDAMVTMRPGPFQVQAAIAAHHARAMTADETDWATIVALYGQLFVMTPSPVVALNRAVAIAMADGPRAGLEALHTIEGLDGYHLFHAARAEMLLRLEDRRGAAEAFAEALALAQAPAERRHLERRIEASAGS